MARALVVTLAVALLAPSAAMAVPAAGITDQSTLVTFDTGTPSAMTPKPITGLQGGLERVVGIDARPATGELFAITVPLGIVADALVRTYAVDPATGAATLIGSIPGGTVPGARDSATGVDFNPAVDRIRVVNDGNENFRINPNNGSLAGDDPALTYTAPATGPITEVAHDRNVAVVPPTDGTPARPAEDAVRDRRRLGPAGDDRRHQFLSSGRTQRRIGVIHRAARCDRRGHQRRRVRHRPVRNGVCDPHRRGRAESLHREPSDRWGDRHRADPVRPAQRDDPDARERSAGSAVRPGGHGRRPRERRVRRGHRRGRRLEQRRADAWHRSAQR